MQSKAHKLKQILAVIIINELIKLINKINK